MASAAERISANSSDEKNLDLNDNLCSENNNKRHTIDNLPDPDAGLSAEEKAVHVNYINPSFPRLIFLTYNPHRRTANFSAN
jgi:hypothetical protein